MSLLDGVGGCGGMETPSVELGKLRPSGVVTVAGLSPSFRRPAARTPGGERGLVITFRPLMSRPELAGPPGLSGEQEPSEEGSGG